LGGKEKKKEDPPAGPRLAERLFKKEWKKNRRTTRIRRLTSKKEERALQTKNVGGSRETKKESGNETI